MVLIFLTSLSLYTARLITSFINSLFFIISLSLFKNLDNIQYFDGNGIKSQVVGTIAGMILSYGDWRKPMIGFTQISDEDENLKVSLRCSRLLAYDGIHFGNIIRKVSKSVGGSGGGHSVACGAYIPIDKKEEFLSTFNNQLNGVL